MTKPSPEFVLALQRLRDDAKFTGVVQIHCHQGIPARIDVPSPPVTLYQACKRGAESVS